MKHWIILVIILLGGVASAQTCREVLAPEEPTIDLVPEVIRDGPHRLVLQFRDTDSRFTANGTLTSHQGRNFLSVTIVTKIPGSQKRPQLFTAKTILEKIVADFEARGLKVDVFQATWQDRMRVYGNEPSDNYINFAKAYGKAVLKKRKSLKLANSDQGLPKTLKAELSQAAMEAAWSTWTGQQMRELGFKTIEAIVVKNAIGERGLDGNYDGEVDVEVIWNKQPTQGPIKLYDEQTVSHGRPADGSSMPRFHQIVDFILSEYPD